MQKTFDIIIIGSGLVGLTMGLSLARKGFEVCIIDKNKKDSFIDKKFDARVSALALGTKNYLETLNIWPDLEKVSGPINDILVTDEFSSLSIDFSHDMVSNQPMGYMVKNNDLYRILFKALEPQKNVKFICGEYKDINISDQEVTVSLTQNSQVKAKLLIASDGKNSPIRNFLQIPTLNKSYGQTAMICNVSHEKDHLGLAVERFFSSGPFAILPMSTGFDSALVWSEETNLAKDYLKLEAKDFEQELEKRFGDFLGTIKLITKPESYPLNLVLAKKYTSKKVVLIGDAAHSIHPIAGQGYNLAVRDVKLLTEKLTLAKISNQDIASPSILKSYEKLRLKDVITMSMATHALTKLFSNNILPIKLARKIGLATVNQLGFVKKKIIRHAMFGGK